MDSKRENAEQGLQVCHGQYLNHYCSQCPHTMDIPTCIQRLHRDALSLLEAQKPRILTVDEMKSWDKDVWVEDYDEDRVVALDESVAGFAMACMRGKKRCWTARPTEEQRKAVTWE